MVTSICISYIQVQVCVTNSVWVLPLKLNGNRYRVQRVESRININFAPAHFLTLLRSVTAVGPSTTINRNCSAKSTCPNNIHESHIFTEITMLYTISKLNRELTRKPKNRIDVQA